MADYDTSGWKRISACLSPVPPDDIGVGTIELGATYTTMNGGSVKIVGQMEWEGTTYWQGHVTLGDVIAFFHTYELNGRDWTNNPNNPYAIDWRLAATPKKVTGWPSES